MIFFDFFNFFFLPSLDVALIRSVCYLTYTQKHKSCLEKGLTLLNKQHFPGRTYHTQSATPRHKAARTFWALTKSSALELGRAWWDLVLPPHAGGASVSPSGNEIFNAALLKYCSPFQGFSLGSGCAMSPLGQ